MLVHLSARAFPGLRPLARFDAARWMWKALRRAFPQVAASVLMPDHPHVLPRGVARGEAKRRFTQVLRAFTQVFAPRGMRIWQPVDDPPAIDGAVKELRSVRYVHLNPSRAGLVDDPLSWCWSTLRDVLGAVLDPWVDAGDLAAAVGRPEDGFGEWLRQYVTSDPSVSIVGTPAPTPAPATPAAPAFLLGEVAAAAAATTRLPPEAIATDRDTRAVFVALARDQGWRDAEMVARMCGVSARQVRRIRGQPARLAAARLCLGDGRLRHLVPPPDGAPVAETVPRSRGRPDRT